MPTDTGHAERELRGLWETTNEQTELALQARSHIRYAMAHIKEMNFGLALENLEDALEKLPTSTEGGTVWPRLEEL